MISKNVLQADARKITGYGLAAGCQIFYPKIYGFFYSAEGVSIECPNETLFYFIEIFVLLYADDTVILADSAEDLKNSFDSYRVEAQGQ